MFTHHSSPLYIISVPKIKHPWVITTWKIFYLIGEIQFQVCLHDFVPFGVLHWISYFIWLEKQSASFVVFLMWVRVCARIKLGLDQHPGVSNQKEPQMSECGFKMNFHKQEWCIFQHLKRFLSVGLDKCKHRQVIYFFLKAHKCGSLPANPQMDESAQVPRTFKIKNIHNIPLQHTINSTLKITTGSMSIYLSICI